MCNLSEGIYRDGYAKGYAEGYAEGLAEVRKEGIKKICSVLQELNIPREKIIEVICRVCPEFEESKIEELL